MKSKVWALIIGGLFLAGCNNGPEKNKGGYGATSGNPPYGAQAGQKAFPKATDNSAKGNALPPFNYPNSAAAPGNAPATNNPNTSLPPGGLQPLNSPAAPFNPGALPLNGNPNPALPTSGVPARTTNGNLLPYQPPSDFGTNPGNSLPAPIPVNPPAPPFK